MSNHRKTSSSSSSSSSSGERKIDDADAPDDADARDDISWEQQLTLLNRKDYWEKRMKKHQERKLIPGKWDQAQKDSSIAVAQSVLDQLALQLPRPPNRSLDPNLKWPALVQQLREKVDVIEDDQFVVIRLDKIKHKSLYIVK